jgi:diphthamide synthase subunit DPH2
MKLKHGRYAITKALKKALLEKDYNSLRDWANVHQFPYDLVKAVACGRIPADSGKAFEIKKALIKEFGIKVLIPDQASSLEVK